MRRRVVVIAIAGLGVAALLVFGRSGADGSPDPRIACVDSTYSTAAVRDSYLAELEEVAAEAARAEAEFFAAACGANATGTVRWPIHKRFKTDGSLDGDLARESAEAKARRLGPRLERLVQTQSARPGTPLGQMLAVAARQCAAAGGQCRLVMFTDGEWADRLLRVRDGVTASEQRHYIEAYAPRLRGLAGASVAFVGVGGGTHLGEVRLYEAQRVATALIRKSGGEVTSWNVRLPSTFSG